MARVSRRRFLSSVGAVSAGFALTAGTAGIARRSEAAPETSQIVPFRGPHQAGIDTPAQEQLFIAAFDLATNDVHDVRSMLRSWTEAAELMCAGEAAGAVDGKPFAPPYDTGEAIGLTAANLTISVGFGPTFFEKGRKDRFGIGKFQPEALIDLPPFAGDVLDPARCGGDLVVQACANDAQVTFHAVRNLARIARGVATIRWSQHGFGRTSSTSRAQDTPRNLLGFKDGTNNIRAEDKDLMSQHVWVHPDDQPSWMHGGTYMVARRIRMLIEVWDRSGLADQEQTFGRSKVSGTPYGGKQEFTPVDLTARDRQGALLIHEQSHIRLASPSTNNGAHLLRRGYSYSDGLDSRTSHHDAGLVFICFQRDPRTQFVPIQQNLAADLLNEYIKHTGSGVFAIPPGTRPGEYIGQTLLG